MAFRLLYKKLFEVEVQQNYCLDRGEDEFASMTAQEQAAQLAAYRQSYHLLDDFALFPTRDTWRTMANYGMLCKTTSTGFFVALPVQEAAPDTFAPERVPSDPFVLRFALRLKATAFMNYTNLSLYEPSRKIYYFSNLPSQAGTTRTAPSLSLIPPSWQNGTAYKAGDLVRRVIAGTDYYMARVDGTHSRPPVDASSSTLWRELAGVGYVNSNDRITLYPPVFTFAFPPDDEVASSTFTVVAPDGTPHNAGTITAALGQSLTSFPLDLRMLSPGRYRLDVAGLDTGGDPYTYSEEIYLDPDLPAQRIFGLVEVFYRAGTELGAYRLLDDDDHLVQPSYLIQLLNRYTFWRYLFKTAPDNAPNITDFDTVDTTHYVTRTSYPLTKSFTELNDEAGNPLPNPSVGLVKPEDDRVFSEVYLLHH